MNRKECNKCNLLLPVSKFHKDKGIKSGIRGICKKCVKKYRENNQEHIKEYMKKYDKQYYLKNKKKILKRTKKYFQSPKGKITSKKHRQSPKGRKTNNKSVKKYQKNNPETGKAHNFINCLLRDSDFTRDICSICGKNDAEFHHENYDLPNFGYWFCNIHHNEIHRGD